MKTIAEELNVKLEAPVTMEKSNWKKRINVKVQTKIQQRSEKQIQNKTKLRILRREGKKGRNEYIATCVRGLIKDIKRIRLYVWKLKENYPREEKDIKCPIYNKKEDTAEYVLEC